MLSLLSITHPTPRSAAPIRASVLPVVAVRSSGNPRVYGCDEGTEKYNAKQMIDAGRFDLFPAPGVLA